MCSNAAGVRTCSRVARMAARESALPASVPPIPPTSNFPGECVRKCVGRLLRCAVGGAGDAAADGLAEDEQIGMEIPFAGAAAGAGADRVGFVGDEEDAVAAGEFASGGQ